MNLQSVALTTRLNLNCGLVKKLPPVDFSENKNTEFEPLILSPVTVNVGTKWGEGTGLLSEKIASLRLGLSPH